MAVAVAAATAAAAAAAAAALGRAVRKGGRRDGSRPRHGRGAAGRRGRVTVEALHGSVTSLVTAAHRDRTSWSRGAEWGYVRMCMRASPRRCTAPRDPPRPQSLRRCRDWRCGRAPGTLRQKPARSGSAGMQGKAGQQRHCDSRSCTTCCVQYLLYYAALNLLTVTEGRCQQFCVVQVQAILHAVLHPGYKSESAWRALYPEGNKHHLPSRSDSLNMISGHARRYSQLEYLRACPVIFKLSLPAYKVAAAGHRVA